MKVLFVKEIRQLWRTFRLPALLLAGLFFALLDPIGAKYMPQIMEKFMSGSEGITIVMPEMGPADALISFFSNLTQIGTIIVIIIAMGAVAKERERGISAWMLTRPFGRPSYFWSKYVAYSTAILLAVGSSTTLAALYTTTLISAPLPAPVIWGAIFITLYLELILAITLSASTLFRSQVAAGGIAFASMILLWLPQLLFDQSAAGKYMPYRLISLIAGLLKGNTVPADFLPAIPAALITAAVALTIASLSFRRAEL